MAKKILFIEDEEALQKTLSEALKQEGYDVVGAFDGEEGLAMSKKSSYDLILLDLRLPKKDGFDVLNELKSGEDTKNIPVIVLTNLETALDIQKALDLGATTYLVKANYDLDSVLSKIEQVLK
ncbi:MAG: response regulator [Candidatus Spechtbacterales bacterium]